MKRLGISYAMARSFKSIFRAMLMSLATVLLLSCFLLVLGSYGLLHFNVFENISGVSAKGQAAIFLQEDCTDEDVAQMKEVLEGHCRTGLLKEFTYISATDALRSELDKFTDYPQLYQSLQSDNPYRASFVVSISQEASFENALTTLQELVITRLNENGEAESYAPVATVVSHQKTVNQAEAILANIRNGVMVFLLILLVVCVFVLINTIRLSIFNQRKELSVMRFLGATHRFLVAPFVLQGMVLGFVSAGITFFTQWFLYQKVCDYLTKQYSLITLMPFESLWYYLLAAFLFVGLFVGLVGSLLSTARHLKDKDTGHTH